MGDTTVSSATARPHRATVDIPTRVLVFGMARATGDPVTLLASDKATAQDIAELKRQLGLDQPLRARQHQAAGLRLRDVDEIRQPPVAGAGGREGVTERGVAPPARLCYNTGCTVSLPRRPGRWNGVSS